MSTFKPTLNQLYDHLNNKWRKNCKTTDCVRAATMGNDYCFKCYHHKRKLNTGLNAFNYRTPNTKQ